MDNTDIILASLTPPSTTQIVDTNLLVPNQFPTKQAEHRIAIVGEAPGNDETQWQTCQCGFEFSKEFYDYQNRTRVTLGYCPQCQSQAFKPTPKPFVGASGRFLTSLLLDSGIDRRGCYLGNVCQIRPPNNDLTQFYWGGSEIQAGLAQLRADMETFRPNLVVLLGKNALRAAKGTYSEGKRVRLYSLEDWRGSVFIANDPESPFCGIKCLPTYHPASLFRVYENTALVKFDLKKAARQAQFPEVKEAPLVLDVFPDLNTILARLRAIRANKIPISVDIEGHGSVAKKVTYGGRTVITRGMKCIGISPEQYQAFIIPFCDMNGNHVWTEQEEYQVWTALAETLGDPNVPKCLQNGMYDAFVLAWLYKILIRGIKDDTMIKFWELYCELSKSLATQVSLFCEEVPFYKDEGHVNDEKTFWGYCCKDAGLTNRINRVLEQVVVGSSRKHYDFNMDLLYPFLYIELRGLRVDIPKRDQRIEQLKGQAWFEAKGKKKTSQGSEQLLLEQMVGWQINVNSNPDMIKLLYTQLKMPPQYAERADGERTLTANFDILLHLGKKFKNDTLLQCIKVRRIRKHISDLEGTTTDADGRIRSSTNIVGASTGRTSSSEAPTGEGTNLQNRRDEDRDIIIADPDHDFCKCDLQGADGWTVAAHCARLGDATMLEDYLNGLKPAKNIALMRLYGREVNSYDRQKLKQLGKGINADTDKTSNPPFVYYASKRIQHGSNYRMGPAKIANQIYLDTEGEVDISEDLAKELQQHYFARYHGVLLWQEWIRRELVERGRLVCASGSTRLFFGKKPRQGRKDSDAEETVNQACAHEPQHNTTWILNKALLRLCSDPENRRSDNSLIIWPCNQVHDELCVQWPTEQREWAINKMREYFNNPVHIAGIELTIPFEGAVGSNWGEHELEFTL